MLEFIGLCVCSACLSCICCLITGSLCMIPAAVRCRNDFVEKHCPAELQWLRNFSGCKSSSKSENNACPYKTGTPRDCPGNLKASSSSSETTKDQERSEDKKKNSGEEEAKRWTLCLSVEKSETDPNRICVNKYARLVPCEEPSKDAASQSQGPSAKDSSKSEKKSEKERRSKSEKKRKRDSERKSETKKGKEKKGKEKSSLKSGGGSDDRRTRESGNCCDYDLVVHGEPQGEENLGSCCDSKRGSEGRANGSKHSTDKKSSNESCWSKRNCKCETVIKKKAPSCDKKHAQERCLCHSTETDGSQKLSK